MNSKIALVSALAAGMMTAAGMGQTAGPQVPPAPAAAPAAQTTPAPAAATAPALPVGFPARIAIIEFEDSAAATNEGQKAIAEVQKKYEPQRAALDALHTEIESLTKQLQGAPASMSAEEKASRERTIDTKQKQFQRDADDAQAGYDADVQEVVGKIAQKLAPVLMKYVQTNGYTMLLDNTGQPQQGGLSVLWAPGTDISQAVVNAYNASSGVAPPPPAAPSATRQRPAPSTTPKPGTSTTPRTTAPKQ